ncbi:response regulator transcription factor [Amycolatopsis pigmentata]|uniref:Response regulator transcription factor n=1 Tax=Amycolatopsis pigmentata TaxID=450801 RepID=A0ABW5G3C3_9PSEU
MVGGARTSGGNLTPANGQGDCPEGAPAAPLAPPAALSVTEREVARLVATGMTKRQIAARLIVSIETVKTHLRHIFDKLAVQNRAQVAALTVTRGTDSPG